MDVATAQEAFERACDDAQLGERVVFIPYTAEPTNAPAAAFHAPGEQASPQELQPLTGECRRSMSDNEDRYRVVCWLGLPDPVVRAVLRHELEHARQWKWGGGLATFQLALAERDTMDFVGYANLPANGQTYNLVPIELDANGAASRFVRRSEGAEAADEYALSVDPGLFRLRPPPEPLETLPLRVLCHGAVWPDDVAQFLSSFGPPLALLLDRLLPDGREIWRSLRADDELVELRQRVTEVRPTAKSIEQAESLETAWAPTKAAVLAAADRARELVGLDRTPT